MKKIYQGVLFVAFFVLLGIIALMVGSGMMAKSVSKEEYSKYYKNEGTY